MNAFADTNDLAEYLCKSKDELSDDCPRMLDRASELISDIVVVPIKSAHADALKRATCAQVEYWLEVGEETDIEGPVQGSIIGKVQIQYGAGDNRVSPRGLAPRAERVLSKAGLLYRGALTR